MTPPHDRFAPESYEDYLTRTSIRRERVHLTDLDLDADALLRREKEAGDETERALHEDRFEDWNDQSTTKTNHK